MIDFTKNESIATLQKYGYTYLGYNDAGWGEKFYTFMPNYCPVQGGKAYPLTFKLGELRRRAYLLDMSNWFRATAYDEYKERVAVA